MRAGVANQEHVERLKTGVAEWESVAQISIDDANDRSKPTRTTTNRAASDSGTTPYGAAPT
jgi:hypothetical protein